MKYPRLGAMLLLPIMLLESANSTAQTPPAAPSGVVASFTEPTEVDLLYRVIAALAAINHVLVNIKDSTHGLASLAAFGVDDIFSRTIYVVGNDLGAKASQLRNEAETILDDQVFKGNISARNDLTFSTIVGRPYLPRSPSAADLYDSFDYMGYAAGADLKHVALPPSYPNTGPDVDEYVTYVNTATAVQTFNAYVLSGEIDQSGTVTAIRAKLTALASSGEWLNKVADEPIGQVQRQQLLFAAQNYQLQLQSIQLQRDLLTAQAMTNTLLLLNNRSYEAALHAKALGNPGDGVKIPPEP